MSDEELIKNRIIDLAQAADAQRVYMTSGFLTPLEQDIYYSVRNCLPVRSSLYGGSNSCIRKLICFGSEEEFGYEWESPIRILHIRPNNVKFARECTHRDYLGAVMSLGIERKVTGDIIVRGKEAWMFVLESAAHFIMENLTQVRHDPVVCELVTGEIPELVPRFESITANIASERLDLLIGAATGMKREAARKLLDADKVFINGRLVASAGHKMKPGDELVIRGFGKYIFDGVETTTRKGRLVVKLRMYC